MVVNIQMYFVFVTFLTHEIICRTIDSKTVPTVINALNNQSKTIMENNGLPNTTESAANIPMSTVDSNSLEICEYFDSIGGDGEPDFHFHEHGATVIMRLF